MIPADAYYAVRVAIGVLSSLGWCLLLFRTYRGLDVEPVYERRLWTIVLVSFPAIYSIGYSAITFYQWLADAPVPDPFPLAVAFIVQTIAFVYALRLLRRPRSRS